MSLFRVLDVVCCLICTEVFTLEGDIIYWIANCTPINGCGSLDVIPIILLM